MFLANLRYLIFVTILIKVNLICVTFAIGIESEGIFVEGYNLPSDFDHGEQHCTSITTQATSESQAEVAPFSKRVHLLDQVATETARRDSSVSSLEGQTFPCEDQFSYVVYGQSAMEMLQVQTTAEAYSTAMHDMPDAVESCHRQDLHPRCKVSAAAIGAGHLFYTVARTASRLSALESQLGKCWIQSSQDSKKEVKRAQCQRQQICLGYAAWQPTAGSWAHDAFTANARTFVGAFRPSASGYAYDELGYATYATDADDATSFSEHWAATTIAASQHAMAGRPIWTSCTCASDAIGAFDWWPRVCNASDAKGTHDATIIGLHCTGAHVHAETRCSRAAASYPEACQRDCYERWSEGWSCSYPESPCGCYASWPHAQGIRRSPHCKGTIAQQLEEVLVRCSQAVAGVRSSIRSAGEKAVRANCDLKRGFSGSQSFVSQSSRDGWGSAGDFRRGNRRDHNWGIWIGPKDYGHHGGPQQVIGQPPTAGDVNCLRRGSTLGEAPQAKTPGRGRVQHGCANPRGNGRAWKSFWLGWLQVTSTYFNLKPIEERCILPTELLVAKWTHPITFEPTFLTERGAVECARQWSFELGTYQGIVRSEESSIRDHFPHPPHCHRRVSFCDDAEVLVGSDTNLFMTNFKVPHHALVDLRHVGTIESLLDQQRNIGGRTEVDPLSSLAVCISSPNPATPCFVDKPPIDTCRITDQWHNPIPDGMRGETQPQEPDPDVIPDPVHAPVFVHDLLDLAERHGAFTDLDTEDVFRVRTWYVHHVHQQWNLEFRILEFQEDWRRWEADLRGAWRDHLRANEEVDFNVAFPDPYRGALTQPTHADLILSQGTWVHRLPGIVTTHYSGSSAQPFTFAVAASFGPMISGFNIAVASDSMHWCLSEQHRCLITFGWNEIPCNNQQLHFMRAGHSFVLHIQNAWSILAVAGDHPPRDGASSSQTAQPAQVSEFGDLQDIDFTHEDNPPPGGNPHDEPPEDGHDGAASDASIHSTDKGVLVYRLHARDEHCFVTWSTYMTILDGIVHELRLPRNQIRTFHRLAVIPPDVHEVSEEAVILQAINDVPAGSDEKLILVDTILHFHPLSSGLAVPAAVSRQVMRVNQQLHRSHLLILRQLDDYCHMQNDRCVVHKNHRLWDHRDRTLHSMEHGDYVRIQIPPPEDPELDTETAIAIARGVMISSDSHCGAHLALMQTAVDTFTKFEHQLGFESAIFHFKTDPTEGERPDLSQSRTQARPRVPPSAAPRNHFTAGQLRQLSRIVDDADLIECEEEGRIAYVTTWYLHHNERKICRESRAVRLVGQPEEWAESILDTWHDTIRPGQRATFQIVMPNPPCSIFECNQAHIIVEQGHQEDHVSFVISVVDENGEDQRLPQVTHSAHSDEGFQTRSSIIQHARLQNLRPNGVCSVTWKQFPFALVDPEVLEPATNVVIQILQQSITSAGDAFSLMQNPVSPSAVEHSLQKPTVLNADEIPVCAVDLNRAPNSEGASFQFNAHAAAFIPGQINLLGANEFVLELYAQWSQQAIVWEREEASCIIETWFVDHRWHNPHCRHSRLKNLFANYWQWEDELKQLWGDYIDERSTVELYVVHPKPPSFTQEVAAHVILVQQERDDWVTSLVSVHEAQPSRRSIQYNMAITTHEHILVDNLLRVVGHEEHCLAQIPSHGFAAWYLHLQLQRGQPLAGRSGYGISLQIWQYCLADFLPQPMGQAPSQQGQVLLQKAAHRQKIMLEELIVEFSDEEQVHSEEHAEETAVIRLHPGADEMHLPSFIEIHGEPTESNVAQELQLWGQDCLAFQFAGHHDFLCLPRSRQPCDQIKHYIFGTIEGIDPTAAFLHSHRGGALQEHECMKILHSLGFLKTAISEIRQCLADVFKVVFSHQISVLEQERSASRQPTPWPDRIPEHLRLQHQPNILCKDIPEHCDPCKLSIGIDIQTIKTFMSNHEFPLCTTFEDLQLPGTTAEVPNFEWGASCEFQDIERIVIFTDGSSISHLRHQPPVMSDMQGLPDTWAFLVLGECYVEGQLKLYLIGWQAQPVRYDPTSKFFLGTDRTGSDASEKEALFWAALWRLSINWDIPTVFCSDSSVSCGQASGQLGTNDYQQPFILLRSLFQALEACLPGPKLEVRHVKGHSNDPWNDFVDYAAKTEREKSFYLPRPLTFDIQKWRSTLPHLWMIFAKDAGLPQFTGQGFDAFAPALLDVQATPHSAIDPVVEEVKLQVSLSMATANVLSLPTGPDGHSGKVDYLRQQFRATGLNLVGLQETRSPQGISTAGDVVRIASGAHRGHHGIELWANLKQPYASANGKPLFFHRRHFTVRHADPRLLLVLIETPFLQTLVLVWTTAPRQNWLVANMQWCLCPPQIQWDPTSFCAHWRKCLIRSTGRYHCRWFWWQSQCKHTSFPWVSRWTWVMPAVHIWCSRWQACHPDLTCRWLAMSDRSCCCAANHSKCLCLFHSRWNFRSRPCTCWPWIGRYPASMAQHPSAFSAFQEGNYRVWARQPAETEPARGHAQIQSSALERQHWGSCGPFQSLCHTCHGPKSSQEETRTKETVFWWCTLGAACQQAEIP